MKDRKCINYAYQLDAFRLFAMITIFWNHCRFLKLNEASDQLFESWFHYGGIGVEFFVMLSGLLVGIIYINKPWDKNYTIDFYKKKAFRLFPMYWISLLFFLPEILSAKGLLGWGANGMSFTLLQSITPKTWGLYNSPAWTISTLWIMYLLSPFFSKILDKLSGRQQIALILTITVVAYILNSRYYYTNQTSIWFFYISPFYRWVTFLQGMIVGRLAATDLFSYKKVDDKVKSLVEVLVIGLFIGFFLIIHRKDNAGFYYPFYFIIFLYVFYIGGGIFSKLLSAKWLFNLAKISYAFYLIHWFVTVNISNYILSHYLHNYTYGNLMILFFVELAFTLGLALLMNKYIENRINSFISQHFLNQNK